MKPSYTLTVYCDPQGKAPFTRWLAKLGDAHAIAKINSRMQRMIAGNFGDYKALGGGLYELRVDYGPGYRVYYCFDGTQIVLLLCAGDKGTQRHDIAKAAAYKTEFEERNL